jgi:hypothetical protein
MNLFYLDENHKKNAEYHVDRHSVKMILEATQILCTTFHTQNIEAPYRSTHVNHPSTIFARQSKENFEWVIEYVMSLAEEYTYRYNKIHKSTNVLEWVIDNMNRLSFPVQGFTKFALAMPEEYKVDCPIQSYRNYYKNDKKHLFSWKNRETPEWIKQ